MSKQRQKNDHYQAKVVDTHFAEGVSIPKSSVVYHMDDNVGESKLTKSVALSKFPKCECISGSHCNTTTCINVKCYYECGSNCAAKDTCMNKSIRMRKWKKCQVFLTEKKKD